MVFRHNLPPTARAGRGLLLSTLFVVLWSLATSGQNTPSDQDSTSRWKTRWHMEHSPLKATVFSAVVPGTGQWYNHKKWKTPIVWGGLATCVYFIHDNSKQYAYYKEQYIFQVDGDPSTVVTADPGIDLDATRENYRKLLDISYMCLAGVYVLQLIDANVDAHLWYFDTSDDLGFSVRPSLIKTDGIQTGLALTLRF